MKILFKLYQLVWFVSWKRTVEIDGCKIRYATVLCLPTLGSMGNESSVFALSFFCRSSGIRMIFVSWATQRSVALRYVLYHQYWKMTVDSGEMDSDEIMIALNTKGLDFLLGDIFAIAHKMKGFPEDFDSFLREYDNQPHLFALFMELMLVRKDKGMKSVEYVRYLRYALEERL